MVIVCTLPAQISANKLEILGATGTRQDGGAGFAIIRSISNAGSVLLSAINSAVKTC